MYVQRNIEARSRDHCCQGKTVSIKYYGCVSAFLPSLCSKQISSFLHHIKSVSAAWLETQYFPILSDKQHHFRKKKLNIEYVF